MAKNETEKRKIQISAKCTEQILYILLFNIPFSLISYKEKIDIFTRVYYYIISIINHNQEIHYNKYTRNNNKK